MKDLMNMEKESSDQWYQIGIHCNLESLMLNPRGRRKVAEFDMKSGSYLVWADLSTEIRIGNMKKMKE